MSKRQTRGLAQLRHFRQNSDHRNSSQLYFRDFVKQSGRGMIRKLNDVKTVALAGLLALGYLNGFGADADSSGLDLTLLDKSSSALLTRSSLFENKIAYLRVSNVETGLDQAIGSAWPKFSSTTNLIGLVLDLRYADGANVEAARAAASLIEAKKLPLTILVNGNTRGEAVELTAMLRKAREGLVFGSPTAAATSTNGGLQPDIEVKVSPENERAYFADAFKVISPTGRIGADGVPTNEPSGDRITEAELVRQRLKDTGQEKFNPPARPAEPQSPLVRDPVLARAMDLLKGLAIVREAKL